VLPPDLRGRVARPAPAWWNVTKTLIQMACFWSVFLAVLPLAVVGVEDRFGLAALRFDADAVDAFGAALLCFGSALGSWSALVMALRGAGTPMPTDSTRRLVIVGPYRRVRNPMVLSGSSQALGVSLILGSPLLVTGVCAGMWLWNRIVRPWEEADLAARFGEPYLRYRDAVPCWRVAIRPYSERPVA
jgi:protein-S-isoprenylcysteine O-methyltransferase Ste14